MPKTAGPWGDLFAQKLAKRVLAPVSTLSLLPSDAPLDTLCWVRSRGGLWLRSREEGTTAWRRLRVSDPKWASRDTWYIGAEGNDDNDGATEQTLLRTTGELFARLADNPLTTGVTVYVVDDVNETELCFQGRNEPDGVHWLYFEGLPRVAATGTIASVTNWTASTNTAGIITGSSTLVPHVGKLLRITGGARAGARFWIVKNTSGVTVRISRVLDGPYSPSSVSLQVGDPYEVLTLPHLTDTATIVSATDVQFALVDIGTTDNAHGIIVNGAAIFDACKLYGLDVFGGGQVTLYACSVGRSVRAQGDGAVGATGCLVDGTTIRSGGTAILNDHVIQAGKLVVEKGSLVRTTDNAFLAVYDYSVGAIEVESLGQLHVNGYIIGTGITGDPAMITVGSNGSVVYSNEPTITGSLVESLVGGYERDFSEWPYIHPDNGAAVVDAAADASPTAGGGGGSATSQPVYDDFGALPAADDDGIVTAFATSTSTATKSGGGLNGVVGAGILNPPRNITITTSSSLAAYNTTDPIVITGTNVNDEVITEERTPSAANGGQVLGTLKCFKTVTSIAFPAQGTTAGQFKVGFGALIGLRQKTLWTASGFLFLLAYYIDASADFQSQYNTYGLAASPPNGAIEPTNTLPDGGTQFAAAYIKDLT